MKRTPSYRHKLTKLPVPWLHAGHPAPRAIAADTLDDRVSENIFDVDDEQAEVAIIVNSMNCGAN